MERLTNHFDYCDFTECRHYDKELAKSDSCNFIHSSRERCLEYAVYNKLREYEDLEEQGLLLKLPCKVGDKVYQVLERIRVLEVTAIGVYGDKIVIYTENWETGLGYSFDLKQIGRRYFLTKEEAEEALRKKVSE